MLEEQRIKEFMEALSSGRPVPGGGGASALGGALGAALGSMVANLTIGKKRYADVEGDIKGCLDRLSALQSRFIELAEEDEKVFAPLAAAYGLPAGTPSEREHKEAVLEENLDNASMVPLKVMEQATLALGILKELGEKGSRMAISDVGVGVQFVRAALLGAAMNVYINTKSMKDRGKADEINGRADALIRDGMRMADEVYGQVLTGLR